MKEKRFPTLLIAAIALCLLATIGHVIYAAYAYEHSSIIYFIAKELW